MFFFCFYHLFLCPLILCFHAISHRSHKSIRCRSLWTVWVTASRNMYVFWKKSAGKYYMETHEWSLVGFLSAEWIIFVLGESVSSMPSIPYVLSAADRNLWHYNSLMNTVQIKGRFWTQGSIWTQMTSTYSLQEGDSIYFHLNFLSPDWRNS